MSKYLMLISGGTTNTRFALLKDDTVVTKVKIPVGAGTTRDSSRNIELENVVRETIHKFEADNDCHISAIVASGMITSNVGLKEIPHLEAPVTLEMLSRSVVPYMLENISEDVSIYMVPGIKFHTDSQALEEKDLMRGEETEIFGMVGEEARDKTIVFLHLGSHGKAVLYQDRAIRDSVTTFGGALLVAICNNTILQSSVSDLNNFEIQPEYVEKGYETCHTKGLTRTLFLSRISNISEGRTSEEVTSFIYGAMIHCDLKSFLPMMDKNADKIIVYGRDNYVKALLICVEKFYPQFKDKISAISFADSENLSIQGMNMIYQKISKKG